MTEFDEALRFVRQYTPPADVDPSFARTLAAELRVNTPTDEPSYKEFVERLKTATGLKGKALFQPLRLVITGSDHGPELVRAIPLLKHASDVDRAVLSPLARVAKCIR